MDLYLLRLNDDLEACRFQHAVIEVWLACWQEERPCALLLNHVMAQNDIPWKHRLAESMQATCKQALLTDSVAWEQALLVKQLAPSCLCCAQQGQLGLVLASLYRGLKAFRKATAIASDETANQLAVLLVGSMQLSEAKLMRGLRYLQPPVRVLPVAWGGQMP